MKLSTYLLGGLVLACSYGCEPECRTLEPMQDVRQGFLDKLDASLDDMDATGPQRKVLMGLGREALKPLPAIRAVAVPKVFELTTALRKPKPSRKELARISEEMMQPYLRWFHDSVPMVLAGHKVLNEKQRAEAVEQYEKRSESFEGSWFMDRAVDYLLNDIDATREQAVLLKKIVKELVQQLKIYQRRMHVVRHGFAVEFRKAQPSATRIHETVDLGYKHTRRLVFDVIGYYIYFTGELSPEQKRGFDRYLLLLEPCRKAG